MITQVAETPNGLSLVNARAYVDHFMCDEVSLAIGSGHYATFPYTVELAFFKEGRWVNEILPEFAAYAEGGPDADCRVYPYVPLIFLAQFLENYGTGKD